jgi:hypothetical protein
VDPVEINVPKILYVKIQFVNQIYYPYHVLTMRFCVTTSVLTNGVTIKIAEFAEMYVLKINSVITEAVTAILLKLNVMINVTH